MTRPIGIGRRMSLGFEQAGFDVAAAVEIGPIHCATHEFNFPKSTAICASVIDLTGAEIRRRADLDKTDIDVVFGGAPCQGFSLMGKRSFDDPRNQLVFHYVRLVNELRPKYCVFENVKGLTLGTHARFLAEIVEALQASDYDVLLPYQVLNASDFSVPQDRRRLFLIAARRGLSLPSYPRVNSQRTTVADAISDLPDADQHEQLRREDAVEINWKTRRKYAKILRGMEADAIA